MARPSPFPSLPARPLGLAVQRVIDPKENCEEQGKRCGTTYRTMHRWLTGDIERVKFNKADEVLLCLRLHWWDVWTEQNTSGADLESVRFAFEGDGQEQLEAVA